MIEIMFLAESVRFFYLPQAVLVSVEGLYPVLCRLTAFSLVADCIGGKVVKIEGLG